MKIKASQIPPQGVDLEEYIPSADLDLGTEMVKFTEPVKVNARFSMITNVVNADLEISAAMLIQCGRCLKESRVNFKKKLRLNYTFESPEDEIDLNPDIREEIIIDYPIKPLCRPDCRGLCAKCGCDLNEGGCKHK